MAHTGSSPILATTPVMKMAGFFICAMSTGFIHRGRTSYTPLAHMGSSPILATTPVMKMAGVFIIVITRSIIPLYFLYHLPCLSGIYRKYFT